MNTVLPKQRWLDLAAMGASALCLVHCLALPALLILVPTIGVTLAFTESFHLGALVFAVPVSVVALALAYRHHGLLRPAMIVAPGILLLALGVMVGSPEWLETVLTVIGSMLLAVGHVHNWRAARAVGGGRAAATGLPFC